MATEGYKSVTEFAEAWGVTSRRVRDFCVSGRIAGVKQEGRNWLIPSDAEKPVDGRTARFAGFGGGEAQVCDTVQDAAEKQKEEEKMAERRRNMMDYCPDIKVVDATMRDGGLVNNFGFSDEFVRELYQANIAAGVDYMEFGYRASKTMFNPSEFGKWKFTDEGDLRAIVGDNDSPMKISIMADAGRTDYKTDILPRKDSVVDLVRVACYIHQIPTAIDMIEDAKAKGYEVSCNLMAVSKVREADLLAGLKMLAKSSTDMVYIVDSFGNYYPEEMAELARKYIDIIGGAGKEVGFHGHNNQQLAFANTIECCRVGVNYLDATVNGLGRGAGNCYSEALLSFLKNPKFKAEPILDFITKHMLPMKAAGVVWGYDVPYLLTGIMNVHPSSAIKFIKDGRTDYSSLLHEIMEME